MEAVHVLEQSLGRRLDIVLWYQHWAGWGPDFRPEWAQAAADGGRLPLLTWEPWKPEEPQDPRFGLAAIAEGGFDAYAEEWAEALRAYGGPVYLRPMHEMNGNWYPWGGSVGGNSPEAYVAAWRRLHELFTRTGAWNVRWVWSPCADDVPMTPENEFERYYPGSDVVDVLALDGYNWGAAKPEYGGWRSFEDIFAEPYDRIARLGRQPVWVAETASDASGGDKAAWVRDMFETASRLTRLEAIVWFHTLKERDWRATSPDGVAAAFRAAGQAEVVDSSSPSSPPPS